MRVKVDINKLRELISEDVLKELLENSEKENRIVTKYGSKISVNDLEDKHFLKSLLHHNIVLMVNNEIYCLPWKVEDKELKLYYRTIKK